MNKTCENCKFCEKKQQGLYMHEEKTSFGSFFHLDVDEKIKYFCNFMPKEIKKRPNDWCSQFKPKFNNEYHNETN